VQWLIVVVSAVEFAVGSEKFVGVIDSVASSRSVAMVVWERLFGFG
jgi:hypothetical protein